MKGGRSSSSGCSGVDARCQRPRRVWWLCGRVSLGDGKCGDNGTGVNWKVHVARKEEGATTVRSEDIIRQQSQTS